jgi:hypothetical protein
VHVGTVELFVHKIRFVKRPALKAAVATLASQ